MIVTFVSECRKRSIQKTQRILDTYAYRIGRRTWQANLTEQGLEAIRQRLTKEATRSTAIACHRVTSRRQTELVWVVGNRRVFDSRGRVAVHYTRNHKAEKYADGMWQHLPLMRALIRMAGLWHDFGKAAEPFQQSLRQGRSADVLRHEWLSLALFDSFVADRDELSWLQNLTEIDTWWNDQKIEEAWIKRATQSSNRRPLKHPIEQPVTRWIKWLIVSHHLLPKSPKESVSDDRAVDWNSIVADVDATWGYEKPGQSLQTQSDLDEAFSFPSGLPIRSKPWREAATKTASSLITERDTNVNSRWDQPNEIERALLVLARASLMRGDHQYSSEESETSWRTDYPPFANTRRSSSEDGRRRAHSRLKQRLDEHLVRVADCAEKVAGRLPYLQSKMPSLEIPRELRKASPEKFQWQNKAVSKIQALNADRSSDRRDRPGTLIINTAGTGTGKTTANAKMLAALNPDDLRVAFALGLRTLTLQTGDEYRERLKLKFRDMQVIIGSRAVLQLHQDNEKSLDDHSLTGDYDWMEVPDEEFFFGEANPYTEEERALGRILEKPRDRRLLLSPFLVCTIDHLIPANDGVRGGHQVVPLLRLMSSDVVIDEIDDYDAIDLVGVLRLVHLVGLLGRDLLISSATITPSIALAVFDAYDSGRRGFAAFQNATPQVDVFWVDEFQAKAKKAVDSSQFVEHHAKRMRLKSGKLAKATPKRRGQVFPLVHADHGQPDEIAETKERHQQWVHGMASAVLEAHRRHCQTDPKTRRLFSIGLIRVANIEPCVAVANHLLEMDVPDDFEVRLIVYHSRQVLILRSEIESYLGELLNRREDKVLDDPIIQQRLSESKSQNVIFTVVASPVCEVGRDHDYDWTVAEPSSMRSLIQVCGRVLRHRKPMSEAANVYVPDFNYRAFVSKEKPAAFTHPGFEDVRLGPIQGRTLQTKQLTELIDLEQFAACIDARPRMVAAEPLQADRRLADLEHAVLTDVLNNSSRGEHSPYGWNHGCHYLTDAAQRATPFRRSAPETHLYLRSDDGELAFFEPGPRDSDGVAAVLTAHEIDDQSHERLWLPVQAYNDLIKAKAEQFEMEPLAAMKRFGELMVPDWFLDDRRAKSIWIPELGAYREHFIGEILD
ncbi:CRISPR-associated nuclease/helicase Cas3 subtype I-F/YPEST [Crateriforma conspicua]|uniref:CRISPR-associated nuclease/helicase Cas3 subtype I-F/YPEST n=1 Tax=Crateriforma conspicua TaxID=2527996 RepID=A0A5C6FL95_9PLAN|nr:type I-F CRISPR-associated helicase Cas3f [Crateriforma conspicua]TWU62084.1 CRISPR-associated nuclease/helicase Cas3 subtype I-F/YPEST [Crateriforma conspicua]